MASDAHQPVEPARTRLERGFDATWKKVAALLGALTLVFGTILKGNDAWHVLFPPAKPISATVAPNGRPLLNQTLAQYVGSHPNTFPGTFTQRELQTNGIVFTSRLELKGLSGKHATLSWSVLDGNTQEQRVLPITLPTSLVLTPRSDDAQLTQDVWSAIPAIGDSMFLRFTVTAPGESSPLAVEDGPIVRIG